MAKKIHKEEEKIPSTFENREKLRFTHNSPSQNYDVKGRFLTSSSSTTFHRNSFRNCPLHQQTGGQLWSCNQTLLYYFSCVASLIASHHSQGEHTKQLKFFEVRSALVAFLHCTEYIQRRRRQRRRRARIKDHHRERARKMSKFERKVEVWERQCWQMSKIIWNFESFF